MKTLVTLFIVIGTFGVSGAQIGKKITTAPVSTTAYKVPAATFSAAEMALISNTNEANLGIFVADKTLKETQTVDVNAMIAMSISKNIFGDNSPKNYGVTYWSEPVLKLYKKHIEQKLPELIEDNEDKWSTASNQALNDYIAYKIADQLVLAATNAGAYVNTWAEVIKGGDLGPKTLDLLKTKTKEKFKTETWTADYQQPYYFRDALLAIHYQMPFDYVTDKSYGNTYVSSPANTRGFFFMANLLTSNNCASAVLIAKLKIETDKTGNKLTKLLQSAKSGMLYRPLLEYKNQSAFFNVHQVSMNWLQAFTSTNQGAMLFDKDNNCPSEMAYDVAQKIRSASVFNSAK